MKVVIRADASPEIGIGHIVRCAALAQRLANRGAFVRFACAGELGDLRRFLKGFDVVHIEDVDAEDPAVAIAAISDLVPIDLLIVDHYALDASWERALRSVAHRIMVIDDLADRDHDCDLLLDENIREGRELAYKALVPARCKILAGPRHALLREEFEDSRLIRVRDGSVRRILVFFGGGDPNNATAKAIGALEALHAKVEVRVILGAANPHALAVASRARAMSNTCVFENTTAMAKLISQSDLAIGACGIHCWERCALGLPALVLITAENQLEAAALLHSAGAIECLGKAEQVSVEGLAARLTRALREPERIRAMARSAMSVTFGWQEAMQELLSELSAK